MNTEISFNKTSHSEMVIRKSLYWLSSSTTWELSETESNWVVFIPVTDNASAYRQELHRLVNDQILREKITLQTQSIRKSIITKVLHDIEESL